MRERILALLSALPAGPVLDLGCGAGKHALFFAANGRAVTAVDTDYTALAVLNAQATEHKLPVEPLVADAITYEPQKSFALIHARNLIHFFTQEQRAKLLTRLQQKTLPHGVHLIAGFAAVGELSSKRFHWISEAELRELYRDWELLWSEISTEQTATRDQNGTTLTHTVLFMAFRKKNQL